MAFAQLLLGELASELLAFGDRTLDLVVHQFWCDFAAAVQAVGFTEDDDPAGSRRRLAALFASRLYLQLGSLANSAEYALAGCDLFGGGAEAYGAYASRVVGRCVDDYVRAKRSAGTTTTTAEDDSRLVCLIDSMFQKCVADGRFELVSRLALRTRRLDMFAYAVRSVGDGQPRETLLRAARLATAEFDCRDFRAAVLRSLVRLHHDLAETSRCLASLNDAESVARLLGTLVAKADGPAVAYRIALDLCETSSQRFRSCVVERLRRTVYETSNTESCDGKDHETVLGLVRVLSGEVGIVLALEFLRDNNCTDLQILRDTRDAVYTSICHTATMMANGLMHSGTGSDQFLRYFVFCFLY